MFIKKLKIHNFRNILDNEFIFNESINIFHGRNGVGKTSILEAIHFLSSGKSFRRGSFKNLINFNSDILAIYIEGKSNNNNITFSVSKNKKGSWKAKKNSFKLNKQSDITNIFPVVSIDPDVYQFVDLGPLYRRNFLDWLVFHVKHDYLLLWKKVYKCIKHLNHLYKNKSSISEIDLWEQTFIQFSNELNNTRKSIFEQIQPSILKLSQYMQEEINNLSVIFKQGWSDNLTLSEQLKFDRVKNLQYGQLQHGPHKMDIKINTGSLQASQTLSRGQKKVLSITFYMAYIELLINNSIKPILCLDDFDAELDSIKLSKAADFFINTKTQIFITSVHKEKILKAFPQAEMFHVEHLKNLK
ncbi:MAG: DNA replication/repair protein RecF [Alcanivoracaceae bacterium]|nr:DNA replication/repair protein RecF [Alcanivoracaceae bacterium]